MSKTSKQKEKQEWEEYYHRISQHDTVKQNRQNRILVHMDISKDRRDLT